MYQNAPVPIHQSGGGVQKHASGAAVVDTLFFFFSWSWRNTDKMELEEKEGVVFAEHKTKCSRIPQKNEESFVSTGMGDEAGEDRHQRVFHMSLKLIEWVVIIKLAHNNDAHLSLSLVSEEHCI